MNEKRAVLVIAGGEWQIPLVKKARAAGAFVVCSNLYPDSPAFPFASASEVADVRDVEANLQIAKKYRVHAVVTDQSDIAVPTVAAVCQELGLPGIGRDTAHHFTSKLRMRETARRLGHPTPAYRCCKSMDELLEFQKHCSDLVVKPVDSQSSRGVRRIRSGEEVQTAFYSAARFSSDGSVLAEQFIDGEELTVEGLQTSVGHQVLAISVKRHFAHNPMVADRLLYSSMHTGITGARLVAQHNALIAAMQLRFGITHAEYKYWNDEFWLIEVAARGGGTRISSDIIPAVSGVDANSLLLKMAFGEQIAMPSVTRSQTAAVLQFYEFPQGKVKSISGLDQARAVPGIHEVQLNFLEGSVLLPSGDDRSRHMFAIAVGETTSQVIAAVSEAHSLIQVQYA